jgi:hypothetical protein
VRENVRGNVNVNVGSPTGACWDELNFEVGQSSGAGEQQSE